MEHVWVRHTVEKVGVNKRAVKSTVYDFPMSDFLINLPNPNAPRNESTQTMYGCDNCGLPLTLELFDEPCLAALEDEMEQEFLDGERGT